MLQITRWCGTVLLVAALSPRTTAQVSEETINFFKLNCTSCHTIGGGRLAGPDLKGVTDRRERDWLVAFVQDPKAVIDKGDPEAQKMVTEAKGVVMPTLPTMTRARAEKILDMIAAESLLEKSQFVGLQISDRALVAADVVKGRKLFLGQEDFLEGAPACISCHSVQGLPGLGGGRLGLDLSGAYGRLEGRKALAAWLSSPPSETMQPVFMNTPLDPEEVLALVAYLKDVNDKGGEDVPSNALAFLVLGVGLAAALLMLFDFLWRARFRAVRRPLVEHVS